MPQPGEVWSPGMINLFPLAFPRASSTNAMLPPGSNKSLELLNACSSAPDSWIVSWMSALGRKRTLRLVLDQADQPLFLGVAL